MGILPMKFATSFVLEKLRDDFVGQSGGFDPCQLGELHESTEKIPQSADWFPASWLSNDAVFVWLTRS